MSDRRAYTLFIPKIFLTVGAVSDLTQNLSKMRQQMNQQIRKLSACHYSRTTSAVKNR